MSLQEKTDAVSAALVDLITAAVVAAVKATLKLNGGDAPEEEAVPTTSARKRTRKGAAAPEPEPEEEPAPAPTRARKGKKAAPTKEQVRDVLMKLNEEKGKEAVVEILAEYEVTKIGDLSEESYAEVIAAAEAALEGGEEEAGEGEEEDLFG